MAQFFSIFTLLLLVFSNCLLANEKQESPYRDQLTASFGMSNISYSQLQASFSTGSAKAQSGSVAAMIGNIDYEMLTTRKRSIFFKGSGSLFSSGLNKYYAIGTGMNWYIKSTGAYSNFKGPGVEITSVPLMRYYLGWNLNARYIAYSTKTEVRGDVGIELGGHGGLIYAANKNRGYKAELGFFNGMGVETNSMNIQLLVGITYFM